MRYNLVWDSEEPDLTEDQWVYLSRELVYLESSILNPENLITYLIDFTPDGTGPTVEVYGKKGNIEDLFLRYNRVSQIEHIQEK